MEVQGVIDAIRLTFANVAKGQISLHEAEALDGFPSVEERRAARSMDTEKTWAEISDEAIEECETALCFLDAEGWRYHIPAYMIWSLRHAADPHSLLPDKTIGTFSKPEIDPSRFKILNNAQSQAVCQFLRFMAANDREDANVALANYWGQFCATIET